MEVGTEVQASVFLRNGYVKEVGRPAEPVEPEKVDSVEVVETPAPVEEKPKRRGGRKATNK